MNENQIVTQVVSILRTHPLLLAFVLNAAAYSSVFFALAFWRGIAWIGLGFALCAGFVIVKDWLTSRARRKAKTAETESGD